MEYLYGQWLTVWGSWSISSQVSWSLSWPVCSALNSEGSATGQMATASHVLYKARERQSNCRNNQWQVQLHWAASGCSTRVKHAKYLLSIHHVTQPGSATHHQFWSRKCPSWPSGCQRGDTSSCADWCCWSQKQQGRNFKSRNPKSMWRRK